MPEQTTKVSFDSAKPWIGTFLNVAEPRKISQSPNETARFSANFETDDADEIARIRAGIVEAARMQWPALNVGEAIKNGDLLVPLSDGDKLAEKAKAKSAASGKERLREWSRGKKVLIARSKDIYPPTLTFRENGKAVPLENEAAIKAASRKFFFTGANVLFGISLKAYEAVGVNGKPGVTAYLEAIEACGGGEHLTGGDRDPTERFKSYVGIQSNESFAEAETAGATDW